MKYTHNNGELRLSNIGNNVILKGWVQKQRNLGGLLFIDLRDKTGIVQVVVNPDNEYYSLASTVRNEYVLEVKGNVVERSSKNKNIPTGDIEIVVDELVVLNTAETPAIIISDQTDALEDTRMKYRYLDLRRPSMQEFFFFRHKLTKSIRHFLDNEGFTDFDTPILTKSTPEGARDYLVPSRINNGEFYALPQSPQLFKQLLMVSGFEKYYQLAKCFRDEDLRADRQPEFTQIDIEMSFMSQDEILELVERMMVQVMKDVKDIDLEANFPRLTWDEAMERYGLDKPDTRFDMELISLNDIVKESGFSVFRDTVKNKGFVKCINVKDAADQFSRKKIEKLTDFVKKYQAKGLAWMKVVDQELTGPIAKFFTDEEKKEITTTTNATNNDLLLFVADKFSVVSAALGNLRNKIAKELDLIDESKYNYLWVTDFPLFEYNEEDKRYYSLHHPFTMPKVSSIDQMVTNPEACYSYAYDLVLNGYELGSGSIRIHNQEMQSEVFSALNISKEEAESKFGFFLEALKYGTPPHGGIGLGLERIMMCLMNTSNIKDVVLFPKTTSAQCLMTQAPSLVDEEQLDELKIKIS